MVVASAYYEMNKMEPLKRARQKLAELSLQDVRWRREAERATRKVPLLGDSEAVATVEKFQKMAAAILDEEEFRARQIVSRGGEAVRPMSAPPDARGPLGDFEEKVVKIFADWSLAKDALLDFFGLLREEVLMIVASERARAERVERSKKRQRPLDAPPSALGNLEAFVDDLFREEKNRNKLQRPLDSPAKNRGPLASAERRAVELLATVNAYERQRLDVLLEAGILQRPMDYDGPRKSPLGFLESFVVGLIRAPVLVSALISVVIDSINDELDEPYKTYDSDDDLDKYWWDTIYDNNDPGENLDDNT